jgi:hypothetical protein
MDHAEDMDDLIMFVNSVPLRGSSKFLKAEGNCYLATHVSKKSRSNMTLALSSSSAQSNEFRDQFKSALASLLGAVCLCFCNL